MKTKSFLIIFVIVLTHLQSFSQIGRVKIPIMVAVEGGNFIMGDNSVKNDAYPAHKVQLNDFLIGKYEVTHAEFLRFMNATGYVIEAYLHDSIRMKKGYPQRNSVEPFRDVRANDSMRPIGNINWFDAQAYIKWLNEMTGKNYRLPTEAEWEYAAKGGTKSKNYPYAGSANLKEVAWFLDNSEGTGHTVGQKLANELGIYDMAGNAHEWCSDWYAEQYYGSSPESNPQGPDFGNQKVIRGSSWHGKSEHMHISFRNYNFPYNNQNDYGFRLALSGEIKAKPIPNAPAGKINIMNELDSKGFVDIYGIYFDSGKSIVKPESYPVVDQIAAYLKENPGIRLMVEGHTDNTGKAEKNQVLSENRAKSIKAEMVKRGIDETRLETKGFGSSKPIGDNKTKAGKTQNRRVTITKL